MEAVASDLDDGKRLGFERESSVEPTDAEYFGNACVLRIIGAGQADVSGCHFNGRKAVRLRLWDRQEHP
jgi:hypothetical protein